MGQITDKGYILKTQNEYFDEERQLYLDIDSNWNLDPSTPDGLKLAHDSEVFGNFDELAQRAYNSKNPASAKGVDLDTICSLSGIKRDAGVPSTVTLELKGTPGATVFEGDLVESESTGSRWSIVSAAVISPSGSVQTTAKCTENGPTQAAADTINKIVTTRGGWQGVTNPTIAVIGRGRETDAQLRRRRKNSVSKPGSNMVESIFAEVSDVDNVRNVKVYENDENFTDGRGMPPHSIAVVVDGGANKDVAQAIYRKRGPGTTQHQTGNNVEVVVTSELYPQFAKLIKFSRPTDVDVTIAVTIKSDGTLPGTVDDEIKDAIIDYTNGELIDATQGFNVQGFDIEENVPAGRFYTPVNKVIGKYGDSYVTALTVNGAALVTVGFAKMARFDKSRITITKV